MRGSGGAGAGGRGGGRAGERNGGRGQGGGGSGGCGGGGEAEDVDVELLTSLAVARDAAEEEVVASGFDGYGVVAGGVSL